MIGLKVIDILKYVENIPTCAIEKIDSLGNGEIYIRYIVKYTYLEKSLIQLSGRLLHDYSKIIKSIELETVEGGILYDNDLREVERIMYARVNLTFGDS